MFMSLLFLVLCYTFPVNSCVCLIVEIIKIYDGDKAGTRTSQTSFRIIYVSCEALSRVRRERSLNEPEISLQMPQHHFC